MERKIRELEHSVLARDTEISRLAKLYSGGQNFDTVKVTFDRESAEDMIHNLKKQNEFVNQENHRLETEIAEIKELLGIADPRDPTDKNRAHLKKLIKELKSRNDLMTQEIRDLT